MAIVGESWEKLGDTAPNVIIVNLDLSGSSVVNNTLPNEWDLLIEVNKLQVQIQNCFEGDEWLIGEWSGDGLVALCLDPNAKLADAAIAAAIKIIGEVKVWRENIKATEKGKGHLKKVDVRIGICSGRIRWLKVETPMTGRIISPIMNKAGHFQKECDSGAILIDFTTRKNLKIWNKFFPEDLKRKVKHREGDIFAYPYKEIAPNINPISIEPIEDRIIGALSDCKFIVKAPGACYFLGEYAVMFGHMALIQPIPRYVYVGIEEIKGGKTKPTNVILKEGFSVKPNKELYDSNIVQTLQFPEDFDIVKWNSDELEQINKIVKATRGTNLGDIFVHVYSMVPEKCGLNSSSAVSMGLAGALFHNQLDRLRDRLDSGGGTFCFRNDDDDEQSLLFKTAWAFDNVFHGGKSSGAGLTASSMGSKDGWPLIYMAESRGFHGPYPIEFKRLEDNLLDRSWEPLNRIRFLVQQSKLLRIKEGNEHEFAIFYIGPRKDNAGTKDIIEQFLGAQHLSGKIADDIKVKLNNGRDLEHEYYLPTDLFKKALDMTDLGKIGSFRGRSNKVIPRLHEMIVESFIQALGTCALSGISAFVTENFAEKQWKDFAQCINAYQELMSACGVSQKLADLFNYKSDAFAYVHGTSQLPYGTKLTGAGNGGDFVVMALYEKPVKPSDEPSDESSDESLHKSSNNLSDNFQTFRHEIRLGKKPLPCHFVSWLETSKCFGVTLLKPTSKQVS